MRVHAPVSPRSSSTTHDCSCGCGGSCNCESGCCDLDCLVRPNFFCGQLLTDADLTAVVEWTRRRLSLTRYRDGWGVVCGLDVSCAPPNAGGGCCEPSQGPFVYVNPGYAVDCCGNDLVVCEPLPVDLSSICRPDDDPCAPGRAKNASNAAAAATKTATVRSATAKGCWDGLKDGVFAVDLFLRYHEDLSHGQRALLGGRCGHDAGCEHARVFERPCVHAEPVTLDASRGTAGQDRDHELNRKQRDVLAAMDQAFRGGARGVRDYLRQHPPARFCFLDDLLCCLVDLEGGLGRRTLADTEELLSRLRFWLYYDWFLQQLDCSCWSCRPDTGVPLARVLLRRSADVRPTCKVLFVDGSAPHRRPLRNDECGGPVVDGLDLRRYYWLPRDQAALALAQTNVTLATGSDSEADAFGHLRAGILTAARDQRLQARLVRDPYGVERIAGFTSPS